MDRDADLAPVKSWLEQFNPLCFYSTLTVEVDETDADAVGEFIASRQKELRKFTETTEEVAKLCLNRGIQCDLLFTAMTALRIDGVCGALDGMSVRDLDACLAIVKKLELTIKAPKRIPVEHRTRTLTKAEAAKLINKGVSVSNATEFIDQKVSAGVLTTPIGRGKNWQFDIREFPKDTQADAR